MTTSAQLSALVTQKALETQRYVAAERAVRAGRRPGVRNPTGPVTSEWCALMAHIAIAQHHAAVIKHNASLTTPLMPTTPYLKDTQS